jgi:uncharacterized damage-inducible protein DinB
MNSDHLVRDHLVALLAWKSAHVSFDQATSGIPPEMRGRQPERLPFSPWQLVEHLRRAQHDILDFCRNPDYAMPAWPDDFWPEAAAPPDAAAWQESLAQFRADLQAMQDLVADPETDLLAAIPHGEGQTILREAVLVADHNAYHVGQLVFVRRLLGIWPPASL